jgi:membrane protease YdiL (CAAX protease family)
MSTEKFPPRLPAWNVWQVLFIMGLVTLLEFLMGWFSVEKDLYSLPGFFRFVGIGLGDSVLYLAAIVIFLRVIKRSYKDLGLGTIRKFYLLSGIPVGLFLFLLVGSLENFLEKLWGVAPLQSFTQVLPVTGNTWQLPIILVLGGIALPLKDELLFRGLFYPALRRVYGRGIGIIFSGIFFAFLQFNVIGFIPLFIEGVLLSWLYERSSSLWPSMIAHSTLNITLTFLLWILR